jgi:lysozyme
MTYSHDGALITQEFEGCKLTAYADPATKGEPWTIGWGHTGGVKPGDTCTQEEADEWLMMDTLKAAEAVNHLVVVDLTQHQFDALVDFAYNCGIGNFSKSTLLKLVNASDFEGASKEFPKWDMGGGKHLAGLLRRRLAEQKEFLED